LALRPGTSLMPWKMRAARLDPGAGEADRMSPVEARQPAQ
jgi:hypothetical protein